MSAFTICYMIARYHSSGSNKSGDAEATVITEEIAILGFVIVRFYCTVHVLLLTTKRTTKYPVERGWHHGIINIQEKDNQAN